MVTNGHLLSFLPHQRDYEPLFLAFIERGLRMLVWVDNLKYIFCQTAASGGFPCSTTHGRPVRQSPGRSMRSRNLQSFRSSSSWLTLYPPNCCPRNRWRTRCHSGGSTHRPRQIPGLRARAGTAEPTPAVQSSERFRRSRQPLLVWLPLSADRLRDQAALRVQPSFVQTSRSGDEAEC